MRMIQRTPATWMLVSAVLVGVSSQRVAAQSPSSSSAAPTQGDWPQWRGPNRDSAAGSFEPPASWPEQLAQRWKADVGSGYATPLVVGSRVYVFTRQGDEERMAALDAEAGDVLWQTGYSAPFTMHSGTTQHGPGPKSTPVYSDGRLFAIGMTGTITAFDAAGGDVVWQKPGTGVAPLFTTHAFSPLVDDGHVIFHVGGHDEGALTAFDVDTGDVVWQWNGDGPAYGSPIVADLEGTRQIITVTQRKLVGVEAETGALLWERPYTTPSITNAQTPNLLGNLLIFGDAGSPVQALAISRRGTEWTTEIAWENRDVAMRLSSAVLIGDRLFGLSTRNAGQYFALDARTGTTLWTSPPRQAAHATFVPAGDVLFVLEGDGDLFILRPDATAFEPERRYHVADTDTWTPLVVSRDRLFVKDVSTLALWTWDEPAAAAAAPGEGGTAPDTDSSDALLRADVLFWESIVDSTDPALFEAYLVQFPHGTFRVLAEARLEGLQPSAAGSPDASAAAARPDPATIGWASIPAGRFQMGCVPGDDLCRDDEKPRHGVDVEAFQMMTTDVTVAMYRAYAERTGQPMLVQPEWNTADNLPVVNTSWDDAFAFCAEAGGRLPTEAEWEYAARGGVDGARYSWGDTTTPVVDGQPLANVADEAGRRENPGWAEYFTGYDDGFVRASPVGTFPPNGFGLYDMSGNVTRWISSLYMPYPYRADDGREDPSSRERRVLRGGTYITGPRGLRVSYRVPHAPDPREDYHGFRCVQ